MTQILLILLILATHWFADFVFQTNIEAMNKSHSFYHLLIHVSKYSLCFIPIMSFIFIFQSSEYNNPIVVLIKPIAFALITFICHFATDYYTSKANFILSQKEEKHDFFVSAGFDQLLHYTQLLLTYQCLLNL